MMTTPPGFCPGHLCAGPLPLDLRPAASATSWLDMANKGGLGDSGDMMSNLWIQNCGMEIFEI